MRTAIASVVLVALPSVASANPVTAGVSVGMAQSEADADLGIDAGRTLGLFGRLGLTRRLAGQLELAKHDTEDGSGVTIRSGTALLVVELRDRGALMPLLLAGLGLDRADRDFGGTTRGSHVEGGVGLEYRASGGLTLGADVRLGGRSVEEDDVILEDTPVAYFAPAGLAAGEYRSARVTIGIRF